MAESTSPVGAAFVEHIRAFHQSLPPDEQAMLEEIFALAQSGSDVQGFSFEYGSIFTIAVGRAGLSSNPERPIPGC